MKYKRAHVVIVVAAATALAAPAFAEQAQYQKYQPPRTADGKPSLQGNWTNASITSLQRPPRYKKLTIDPAEVEHETNTNPQVVRQRTDDELSGDTKLNGSDLKGGRGYNAFWIDPGMTFGYVKGEYRTSWIVYPLDGQIPYREDARASRAEAGSNYDGPEARPLGERCIINSNSAGPPMLNYLYNNNYEIVQTPDHVSILAEMNNYARDVRIGGKHLHPNIRPLHGDSIGRWEGDTLVVETTNFHPLHANGMVGLTVHAKVTERFTRVSEQQILYEFTVDDAAKYKEPWRGEMSFNATKDHIYEYACHEGNYALPGVLAGAREQEKSLSPGTQSTPR